ncbi:MAG: hypothetical protein F4X51_23680 [Gemmatimonadetes bacterium]|nr:hypothetical protein [Gemmatimonadota bacterium]
MIFIDGECPICLTTKLHLNTSDLLECPKCNLMIALCGPTATVMQERGNGKFRFEDQPIHSLGIALAPSKDGSTWRQGNLFRDLNGLKNYIEKCIPVVKRKNENIDEYHLWFEFIKYFSVCIRKCSDEQLCQAWSNSTNRTKFYTEHLLPQVANDMNLEISKEKFKVDFVMGKEDPSEHVIPKIYIESENVFNSAGQEIEKLCSLNSPLRILITVDEWPNDPTKKFSKLREWQSIVKAHKKQNKQNFSGTIGILIGAFESDILKFHALAFWPDGDLRDPEHVIFKKEL